MENKLIVNLDAPGQKINRHIYGHFAEHLGQCIYGGFYINPESSIPNKNGIRLDIVESLKNLNIPNLRWPGGCFADEYHWMDGIGPKKDRPEMINTHWGGVIEDNSFGTHEFLELCELLDCEPYISGNLGSGTVKEMSQWIEYLTFNGISPMSSLRKKNGREKPWKVQFWGIGNESWGCGGNMTAEFYADQVRRYSTYCRNYGDNKLYLIACGPDTADYHWMETLMKSLVQCPVGCPGDRYIDGISLHYYTVRGEWEDKGAALEGEADFWYQLMERAWYTDTLITRHKNIMDRYDPDKKIGLIMDEWGTWHRVEEGTNPGFLYQQNTIRDALVASLHLDIFHKHADRLRMANIAQTINVLQTLIMTEKEKMILTPTYHVFEMNKKHQGAEALPVFYFLTDHIKTLDKGHSFSTFSSTVSRTAPNAWLASLTNLDTEKSRTLTIDLRGGEVKSVTGRILVSDTLNGHNSFDHPNEVCPADFDGFSLKESLLTVDLPAHSFITLELRG